MVPKVKLPQGPTHLTKVLSRLKSKPELVLPHAKTLRISMALKNDHFGARHFVNEHLPKIQFDNPGLQILVEKGMKHPSEHWRAEMELKDADGNEQHIIMSNKWSTTILRELMDAAGGDPWKRWKTQAAREHVPVIPGEDKAQELPSAEVEKLPNLRQFRIQNPDSTAAAKREKREKRQKAAANVETPIQAA